MPARSLPSRRVRLIGREAALADIRERMLLGDGRLVTLTGTGGTGKTTLAVEVARALEPGMAGGASLVDLSDVRDRDGVAVAFCESLHLVQDGRPPVDVLAEHLASRQVLLLLDTCEHLLPEVGTLVDRLLDACPELRVLATSRSPLRVRGESVVVVPPMSVPDEAAHDDVVALGRVPAVDLFVERATAIGPGFDLAGCAPSVASICRRLDGLPLAIELAAAQTVALSPAEIDERLAVGQGLWDGVGITAARQRTMEATLDWSHGLLDERQQATFRRLAVFAGGWTLQAAEQVCALGEDPAEVTPTLVALIEASLVVRDSRGAGSRFRMLAPVAEYAARRLAASGEGDATALAHAAYHLGAVSPPSTDWRVVGPEHLDLIGAEHENCLAALRFAERSGHVPLVLGLDVSLLLFWRVRGLLRTAQRRLEAAMAVVGDEPSRERGLVLAGLAHLGQLLGEPGPARERAAEAYAVLEAADDVVGRRTVLGFLGDIAADLDDPAGARRHYEAALALAEADGSELDRGLCRANLGRLAARGGDLPTAERQLERARAHLGSGPRWYLAHVLVQLGCLARQRGDLARAQRLLLEALADLRAYGAAVEAAQCLDELARLALDRQHRQRAATLFSAAHGLRDATAVALREPDRLAAAADVERVRAGLAPGEFVEAWERGQGLCLDEAAELAASTEPGAAPGSRSSRGAALTPREREVAALVAEGLSNARIAERLAIAPGTARIHVERILGKRGLTSRVQIATWVLEAAPRAGSGEPPGR